MVYASFAHDFKLMCTTRGMSCVFVCISQNLILLCMLSFFTIFADIMQILWNQRSILVYLWRFPSMEVSSLTKSAILCFQAFRRNFMIPAHVILATCLIFQVSL